MNLIRGKDMIIELTEEEFKLVRICIDSKCSDLFANCFDPEIQDFKFRNRCAELYKQCTALQKKLETVYTNN